VTAPTKIRSGLEERRGRSSAGDDEYNQKSWVRAGAPAKEVRAKVNKSEQRGFVRFFRVFELRVLVTPMSLDHTTRKT
jgi:hypothetical protein